MPDIGTELISQGTRKSSPLESAGKFVKEKIIDPHTPEAHYRDIMKKYFWVTDKLEGRSLELTRRLRPTVEITARAAGWSQTFTELYFAGQAAALLGFLGLRGLKSAAGVFGDMTKRHGGESAPATVILSTVGASAAATGASTSHPDSSLIAQIQKSESSALHGAVLSDADGGDRRKKKNKYPHDSSHTVKADAHDDSGFSGETKKRHLSAKARRNKERERRGISVRSDDEGVRLGWQPQSASVSDLGGNGRDTQHATVRSAPSQEAISKGWGEAFDAAIGTDVIGVAQKEATLKLLNNMLMDRSDGGFFTALAEAMADPNAVVRKQMVDTAVKEAAEAFGANEDAATAAQLVIEYLTSKSIA